MNHNIVSQQDHVLTALMCAEEGFPVFPVAEGGRPLTMNGSKDATTDVEQITAWWAKWPKAHIGILLSGDMCPVSSGSSKDLRDEYGDFTSSFLMKSNNLSKDWRTKK
jgi:hypothetical protein